MVNSFAAAHVAGLPGRVVCSRVPAHRSRSTRVLLIADGKAMMEICFLRLILGLSKSPVRFALQCIRKKSQFMRRNYLGESEGVTKFRKII
jgi:hypothetical protein